MSDQDNRSVREVGIIDNSEPTTSSPTLDDRRREKVQEKKNGGEKKEEQKKSVPFYRLFSFADKADIALMLVGSLGALGNGVAMPLMTILFGQLIDSFGETLDQNQIVDTVSKVLNTSLISKTP